MNLQISGHHLEITPALREYVTGKIERVTRRFDQIGDIRVVLSIENHKDKNDAQRAECTMSVKGQDLFAESVSHDMYASIDALVDKLDRQASRYKERLKDHSSEPTGRMASR